MLTSNAKRKTEFYMQSPSNVDLPADVIREILLRLPVKPLLRFKCVCKLWYALIGSPSFVNQHFGHDSNQERLLIRNNKPFDFCFSFALYVDEIRCGYEEPDEIGCAYEEHEICCGYEEPDHLQFPASVEALMGPVNGVFCVVGIFRDMALVNPAMRQFKPLPALPHSDVRPHLLSFDNVLGFGLDPLTGDYKLVSLRYFWNKKMNVRDKYSLVSVYSLRSDSWRCIEDVGLVNSSYCVRSLSNTYLDGVYYWLTGLDDPNAAAILAFDMTTEQFQEIQIPDCIELGKRDLALRGDSIALISYLYDFDSTDQFMDVWVLKKGGCWTKLTVGPFQEVRWPLCFWKKNELLFEIGISRLLLCDVFTQKSRIVKARRNYHDFFVHWVFTYKESLVSIKLKGEGDNCMLWDTSDDFIKYF